MPQKPQSYMLFIMMNTQSIFNTIIGTGAFENIDTSNMNWDQNKKNIKKKILSNNASEILISK